VRLQNESVVRWRKVKKEKLKSKKRNANECKAEDYPT
jgi:hypothetical protein